MRMLFIWKISHAVTVSGGRASVFAANPIVDQSAVKFYSSNYIWGIPCQSEQPIYNENIQWGVNLEMKEGLLNFETKKCGTFFVSSRMSHIKILRKSSVVRFSQRLLDSAWNTPYVCYRRTAATFILTHSHPATVWWKSAVHKFCLAVETRTENFNLQR